MDNRPNTGPSQVEIVLIMAAVVMACSITTWMLFP
jgi:hypothetical protein